jgi:hypothetical protein
MTTVFAAFRPPERALALFIAALLALDVALSFRSGARVDLLAYVGIIVAGCCVVALGLFLRARGWTRLGLSVPAFGLYVVYGVAIALACYLWLPASGAPIDAQLAAIDARLGFSWPRYVESFAAWPQLAKALGVVYASSLVQLCGVMFLLNADRARLDRFMFTGLISCTLTCAIWAAFPSAGPSSLNMLPAGLSDHLGLIIDDRYGATTREIIVNGPSFISPWADRGLVAFPSFHTVMALLAVWFLRGKGWIFAAALALNAAMAPAILLHGGHHLTDMLGGAVTFAVALALAECAVRALERADLPAGEPPRAGTTNTVNSL